MDKAQKQQGRIVLFKEEKDGVAYVRIDYSDHPSIVVGSAIAMSAVDNHEKGGMEIAKGALANLAGGAMAKGAGRLANKVGNKTLNRVSNKLIKSKTALTKSVKKNFGVSQKTARKVATNIQSVQKKAAKAVRKSLGKATDIVVSGTTDAIGKQNGKKK